MYAVTRSNTISIPYAEPWVKAVLCYGVVRLASACLWLMRKVSLLAD
jgi:hypothetical protein